MKGNRMQSPLFLLIILGLFGYITGCAHHQMQTPPLSGHITLLRLFAPDNPDVVEQINLATGESRQVVMASSERPSIRSFCYSPDSTQFLFEMGAGENWYANNEIYLGNIAGGNVRRLTNNSIYDGDPAWSPDGNRIAFTRGWGIAGHVYTLTLASGEERPVSTPGLTFTRAPRWAAETLLLSVGVDAKDSWVMAELDLEKEDVHILLNGEAGLIPSPDRSCFACVVSKKVGRQPDAEPKWLYGVNILNIATKQLKPPSVSQSSIFEHGFLPAWSRDSKKLAWLCRNQAIPYKYSLVIYDIAEENAYTLMLPYERKTEVQSMVWGPDADQLLLLYIEREPRRTRSMLKVLFLPDGATKDIISIEAEQQILCLSWDP